MHDTIKIKDHQDIIEIGFEDLEKYHGQAAIAMVAVTFKALQAAFATLFPDRLPQREEISIVSGHPGPGVRDTFEMITRAVTRGAYTVDVTRPAARLSPYVEASYSFDILTADGRCAQVILKDSVLPKSFFDLGNKLRLASASDAEKQELVQLKRTIVDQVLPQPPAELFTMEQKSTRVAA